MVDFNEKTVFVLNHTSYFSTPSADELVLECGTKSSLRAVLRRSLWSITIDAVLQYCRIVFDIFSREKPISLVTFDNEEKIHSIWLDEDQSIETLWTNFTHEGPPVETNLDLSNCADMPGLGAACSMLQMLKASQKHHEQSVNGGRVIVISSFMGDQLNGWISGIKSALSRPVDSSGYSAVTASEWLFIDIVTDQVPGEETRKFAPLPQRIESASRGPHHFFYHQLPANATDLYRGLVRLAELHYNLASTLVQDIPMKEEANANSSSAMYGVELLHRAEAHDLLRLVGLTDQLTIRTEIGANDDINALPTLQRPNSGFSRTLGIKWVTPKSSDSAYLRYASAAYRVTLADVGNRASVCLAQFVLGGRSVILAHRLPISLPPLPPGSDLPPISGNEALLLTCHGSVMYLHTLATVCPLAHPPLKPLVSCPNSANLRVQAFISQIIRPSRLAPASAHQNFTVPPRERAQHHLERSTRYWPLLGSETFLGTHKLSAPLFEHLPKEFLEPNEVTACKAAVDGLFHSVKNSVSLTDTRKSGTKRASAPLPVAPSVQAEAIALALELDHMLAVYVDVSSEHREIHQHWKSLIGSSSGTFNGQCAAAENLGSLELAGMLSLARNLATSSTAQLTPNPVTDALVKNIRSLKLLCKSLAEGRRPSISDEKLPLDLLPFESKTPLVFEPVNLTEFIGLFQLPKRPRTTTPKLEFAGVALADSKGMCQLYRSLRDKEKEKIVA